MDIGMWLVLLLVVWLIYRTIGPVKGLKELNDKEFQAELAQGSRVFLLDVREEHEFQRGHIKGAVNIPLSRLAKRTDEVPTDKELLLYCQSGMRSKRAAGVLRKHGYKKAAHLRGGISAFTGRIVK